MDKARLDEEFSDFVAAGWRRWSHTAYLLTRDTGDAEDLVQQVLTKTYASWRRVRETDAHAYVRRSVVNAYLDEHRRRRVLSFWPSSHDEHVLDVDVPGGEGAADHRDELRRLLGTLTPRERAVVVMRHFLDASQAETAEVLGVSTGTVAATASRALAKLRIDAGTQSGGSQVSGPQTREETRA